MNVVSRVGKAATSAPLRELLVEDWHTAFRSWTRPGLQGLVVYRIGHWARSQPTPVRILAGALAKILNTFVIRNVYGMEISPEAVIGRRVIIGHHQAVQIPAFCVIGDGTVIRQNVNIGFVGGTATRIEVPHIGRDVELGSGSCLLGAITIGDGARIGPNCVVIANVPPGATLIAPPARVMKAKPAAVPAPKTGSIGTGDIIDLRDRSSVESGGAGQ